MNFENQPSCFGDRGELFITSFPSGAHYRAIPSGTRVKLWNADWEIIGNILELYYGELTQILNIFFF